MQDDWENDLAGLLGDLSAVQQELLDVLERKRAALIASDSEKMAAIGLQERELVERLQGCHATRGALLERAENEGLPCDSIRSLAATLPANQSTNIVQRLDQSTARNRLLQHHSLTNWVLVQKTLLHLSQMLEIIATGGREQPTYGKGDAAHASGSLVDRAV